MYNMPEEEICQKQLQDTDTGFIKEYNKCGRTSETEHTAVLKPRNIFKPIRKSRS